MRLAAKQNKKSRKISGRFFSSNFPLRSYTSWDLWCLIPCILSSSVVIASLNKPDSHNKKKKKNIDEKSKVHGEGPLNIRKYFACQLYFPVCLFPQKSADPKEFHQPDSTPAAGEVVMVN